MEALLEEVSKLLVAYERNRVQSVNSHRIQEPDSGVTAWGRSNLQANNTASYER